MKFIIITPAKNEEKYIEKTIKSVLDQTVKPVEWIIVDDGSNDNTYNICYSYAQRYEWIKVIKKEGAMDDRRYGQAILEVFYYGYSKVQSKEFQFFTLLDADIVLPRNYFEEVIGCFSQFPKVGLCGGKLYNLIGDKLVYEPVNANHIRGAFKTYRRTCFDSFGGFKNVWNWDGLDDMETLFNNWEIETLDLQIIHLKPTGSNYNFKNERFNTGRELYITRYGIDWVLLKYLQYTYKPPIILGSLHFIKGYLMAWKSNQPKVVSKELGLFIRKTKRAQLLKNLKKRVSLLF